MAEYPADMALVDAEVAEKVMGWRVVQPGETDGYAPGYWTQKPPGEINPTGWADPPPYSTSILYAWKVLEAWQGDCDVRRQNGQWRVELFKPSMQWSAWAETLPLAICRAALRAFGQSHG